MKAMFLDESGNHGLLKIDPDYPVFVLGGIIVEANYAERVIEPRIRDLKIEFFHTENICLHTADIARNKNGFERLREDKFRERFYEALNQLMNEFEYQIVACAIKKDLFLANYGMSAVDPYLLSLDLLVEQFCFEIGNVDEGGVIYAEKRSPVLDRQLDIAWLNLKVQGTEHVKVITIDQRITGLHTLPKSANIAGLQLADLVVTPIGRQVLGKIPREDWKIVESKLRRRGGTYTDAGLIILPKEGKK